MLRAITHIGITVSDLERSIRFYRDTLGLHLTGRMTMEGAEADALFGMEGCRVRLAYLSAPEGGAAAPSVELIEFAEGIRSVPTGFSTTGISELCLTVSDIDEAFHRLSQAGVRFLSEPQTFDFTAQGFGRSRAVYFRDPDGTILELLQPDADTQSTTPSHP